MTKVFIVILNFNEWQDTIECVKSLNKIKPDGKFEVEVLVIDNASSNDSVEKLNGQLSSATLLKNPKNLGFSGGCNEGARYALKNGANYVVFLNNDTIVEPNFISELLSATKNEDVGAAVPKIYFERGYEFHKSRYKKDELGKVIWYAGGKMDWDNLIGKNIGVDEVDQGQFDIKMETDLATGCCFMIRSDVLENVGLFDDRYFLYYEDADFSQRMRRAGYKIIYEPDAKVWHKNAESSGVGSDLHDYYITRNRLLFGMSYAPFRTKAALIRESFNLIRTGRKWQKKGVVDFYLRRFGRGSFEI